MTNRAISRLKIPTQEDNSLRSLITNPNGAEYEFLVFFVGCIMNEHPIDPDLQSVANAILVKALLLDSLPEKKRGRPEANDFASRHDIAHTYFELVDAGASYADAVREISMKFHKDERHIMRIVKKMKPLIGDTLEERNKNREWWDFCAKIHQSVTNSGRKTTDEIMKEAYQKSHDQWVQRDFIGEMDTKIREIVSRRFAADIKPT